MLKFSLFNIFICAICICACKALYEDQIGKFDWRQRYVGKIKFSVIDSKSSTKKVFVGTEENVVAALFLKSGEIAWRQILERGLQGQLQLMSVENEIVTVNGGGPFFIRGWNPASGFLLYEWLIHTDKTSISQNVLWTVHQGELYQVILKDANPGLISITNYIIKNGEETSSYFIQLPEIDTTNCRIAGLKLVCLSSEGQLRGVSIIQNSNPTILKLNSPKFRIESKKLERSHVEQCALNSVDSTVDFPVLTITCGELKTVIAINENEFIQTSEQLASNSGVAVVPYSGDNHIKLITTQANGEIILSGSIIETGNNVLEVESQYQHSFPIADVEISSSICSLRRDRSISCQLLLSAVDHSIIFVQTPSKIVWTREEALTNVLTVELMDLPVSDVDAAIEKEFDNKEGGFIGMLIRRIMSQILQVRSLLLTILSFGESQMSSGLHADLVRDQFGLHKMIVAVTSVGKLFGIDNLSGEIVWQKFIRGVEPFQSLKKPLVPFYVQRTARHLPHPAQCTILFKHQESERTIVYTFNPINGQPLEKGLVTLDYKVLQSSLLHASNEEFLKGVILLDTDENIHIYPERLHSVLKEDSKSTFLFTANSDSGLMKGYSLADSTEKLVPYVVWQIQLAHKITGIVIKSSIEKVHSQGRVLRDRSVLYKYINPNLVAVITQAEDPIHKNILSIHLIDVVSGSIVFSVVHKRATEPVHVVHSENWVVYSYFSEKTRRTEIATLELYEGKTQSNTTAFSSLTSVIFPMVERQSYILPSGIDSMRETITEKGITSKHILVALNNGGILEIPWIFLDPRRPLGDIREEGVIPYIPELPVPAEAIINYNQTLPRVRSIYTAPSGLESTCLVFVYGLDLFYTRVAPSKTFDVLKEDFDHMLISAVLVALSVAAYATKRLASRKALKQAWK